MQDPAIGSYFFHPIFSKRGKKPKIKNFNEAYLNILESLIIAIVRERTLQFKIKCLIIILTYS